MYKNKIFAIIMTLIMAMSLCPAAVSAQTPLEKKSTVNVALGKPVTANGDHSIYSKELIVDGRLDNAPYLGVEDVPGIPFDRSKDRRWVQVDLGHTYIIDKIEVCDRTSNSQPANVINFDILGSNDESFESYERLGGIGSEPSEDYQMHGMYTILFENEPPAYRYVRYQKAIPGPDIELGELRVFTEFSVREISRNKPAAADSSTVLSAEKGNDGLNEGNGDAWVSAGDAAFRYWQVDLEKPYPIDLIEIEGRNYETTPGDSSGRFLFEIYGSETDMQEKLEELYPYDASRNGVQNLLSSDSVTRLGYIHDLDESAFPAYYPDRGCYSIALDGLKSYRYLAYRKHYFNGAEIGEFRAFVKLPEVTAVCLENGQLKIYFNQNMDASTLNKANITLTGESGVIDYGTLTVTPDGCSFSTEALEPGTYSVYVSGLVANESGVELGVSKTVSFDIELPFEVKNFSVGEIISGSEITASASVKNNTGSDIPVKLITALYKNGRLLDMKCNDGVAENGRQTDFSASVAAREIEDASEYRVKAFLWRNDGSCMPLAESL